jgi:hypothetical protein
VKVMVAGIDPQAPSRGCVGALDRVRYYRSGCSKTTTPEDVYKVTAIR